MSQETELLTEIRDLLRVLAEPALAKRDENLRASLRAAVGGSKKRVTAVLLMDGTRSQASISKEASLDQAGTSRLMKLLTGAKLITTDNGRPRLLLNIPSNFFEATSGE
jgi:hypothetical protein